MSQQPILEPSFWRQRLQHAKFLHQSVFICGPESWQQIEWKHRQILQDLIKPDASVFDAGCAYGRLIDLLPDDFRGEYLGIDLCPDFVELARKRYPKRQFFICDMLDDGWESYLANDFDWAIMISMRPMIRRNLGDEAWNKIRDKVLQVADRILYLEYDVNHPGEIETREGL